MKLFLRIFKFARPIKKFAVPYFICILIHAVFNAFSFVMIIPILNTLFMTDSAAKIVTQLPDFHLSIDYLQQVVQYFLFTRYGSADVVEMMVALSVIVVTSMFISSLFRFLAQKTMENFRIHTLQNVRDTMFRNVMQLNAKFFSNERKGDVLSKLTSDINIVQFTVTSTLQVAFKEPLLIISYFVALVAISWQLTVFTLVFLPITAGAIGIIVKKLRHYANNAQEALGDMLTIADESLSGMKMIKSYGLTQYVIRKFVQSDNHYSRTLRKMATRQQMASPVSEFLGVSAVSVILIYGGGLVAQGSLNASDFIAYIGIFSQITRPARAFADSFSNIHQGLAAGARVMELIDQKPEITDDENAPKVTELKDKIEFRNVHFAYDTHEVIDGISFTIDKGERVALVGASGGGKSTIADLISRYYDVTEGAILIDGKDIREVNLSSLREVVGTVSQEIVLFNDTIEQNIRLGRLDATKEEIVAAAKVANANDFILETEKGYQTNIGDRGAKLSGGQRQRISIARAVLKNPSFLILDEATSALDTQSERLVQEALDALLENRTSLVIAHRLSTIQNADKILVIDKGKIVEQGTHGELLALNGYYKNLIDMQQLKEC